MFLSGRKTSTVKTHVENTGARSDSHPLQKARRLHCYQDYIRTNVSHIFRVGRLSTCSQIWCRLLRERVWNPATVTNVQLCFTAQDCYSKVHLAQQLAPRGAQKISVIGNTRMHFLKHGIIFRFIITSLLIEREVRLCR